MVSYVIVIYIFFVIVACSGHQFHKFSVRLLTHNSVAVVNGLLQSQPCWGGISALERSETVWKHLMKSPFASIGITAQFLFRWHKTAYEESHALLFGTKWHKYGMPAKTHAISCSCSESGISKQSRQNHILDDASMKNKNMSANNQPMSFWSPHLQDLWSLSKIPKKPGKNPTKRNGCQVASVSSGPKFSSRNSCSARKSSQLHDV